MSNPSRTDDAATRRPYDSPVRRRQAAETRARIVAAGSELVHEFDSWHWDALTFRAVAERAGVGERTVYRHFPTERHLHDAVMARLEEEAGVTYDGLDLATLPEITERVFSSRRSFAAREAFDAPADPLFVEVDQRRRDALLHAVTHATPTWTEADERRVVSEVAALLPPLVQLEFDGRYAAITGGAKTGPGSSVLFLVDVSTMKVAGRVTQVGNESYLLDVLPIP